MAPFLAGRGGSQDEQRDGKGKGRVGEITPWIALIHVFSSAITEHVVAELAGLRGVG